MLRLNDRIDKNRGDTLIEVLFAVSVFSLVVVGSLSIMNQGSATAERSLEITLVRQQIDSQAETLRYLNSSYVTAVANGSTIQSDSLAGQWQSIQNVTGNQDISAFSGDTCPSSTAPPANSFILDTITTADSSRYIGINESTYESASSFSQFGYKAGLPMADGIWIQAVKDKSNNQTNADSIDFHINACWDSPGQTVPMTIATIVRLYEPIP
jgi:type II secretory pathway pseudopilin PulG